MRVIHFFLVLFISAPLYAQDSQDLAKKLQNPVSDLVSIPLQFNYDENLGPDDEGKRWTTVLQPVVPVDLNDEWNLVSRTIIPHITIEDVTDGYGKKSGTGDVLESVFFSPKKPTSSGWIWGAGPVVSLPVASRDEFGSEKWSVGPTAVALKQSGPWTMGLLVNYLASIAGDDDRDDVNAAFFQPILGYAWKNGATLTANFEATVDYENDDSEVPFNLIAGKIVPIGKEQFNLRFGVRHYLESYENGPEGTGLRAEVVWLLPK